MVKLGITTAVVFVPRYRGSTTAHSWPCATSALGSASTTSARPPVFENGRPSDAAKRILIISVAILVRSYSYRFLETTGGADASSLAHIHEHRQSAKALKGRHGATTAGTAFPVRCGLARENRASHPRFTLLR